MNLVIRALTLNDQPLSQAIVGCFDDKGGTIGRSDTNTLTLPDPERHISRLQAEVAAHKGMFSVRNAASANPIFINGRALAAGESSVLASRDELRIGGYVLGVLIEADNEVVRTIAHGRAVVDARAVIVGSAAEHRTDPGLMVQRPHGYPATPPPAPPSERVAASSNPFADLLGSAPASNPAADPFGFLNTANPPAAAPRPPPPGNTPARLPDDFDPFADLAPKPRAAPVHAPAPQVGANDLLGSVGAGSAAPPSIDTLFGLGAATSGAADPLAAFLSGAPPSGAGRAPGSAGASSTDPFAMFGPAATPPPAPAPHAAFNHTPELKGAYRPPQVAPPPAAMQPAPLVVPAPTAASAAAVGSIDVLFDDLGTGRGSTPPPASPTPRHGDDALWAAFCEGAGIRVELPQGLNPAQMRVLGKVMIEAVEGTLRLMAVRATAKTELRVEVTTIRTRNNNPLKFSPNAPAALEQLMQPPLRGFMAGPPAMQDAMHDLLGHSIGTMAGMRAALAGVLAKFEPAALERKLVGNSVIDSLLPMNRKAKLWDLYLQHFGSIRDDAQDDFHNLFGAAFVAAYEDQLDRLQQQPGSADGA